MDFAEKTTEEKVSLLGLKFRFSEKIYPLRLSSRYVPPKVGSFLVVETNRGKECGKVIAIPECVHRQQKKDIQILKILRQATAEDLTLLLKVEEEESAISRICIDKIDEYQMPMKLIKTDLVFDRTRVFLHYRVAEENLDRKNKLNFREISRDLVHLLNMKGEFVQVGNRSEAKLTGGYGSCGKSLCCASWLTKPKQVTIKSVKEQGIPINIQKLTGVCGRLQCCLQYDSHLYTKGKLNDTVQSKSAVEEG